MSRRRAAWLRHSRSWAIPRGCESSTLCLEASCASETLPSSWASPSPLSPTSFAFSEGCASFDHEEPIVVADRAARWRRVILGLSGLALLGGLGGAVVGIDGSIIKTLYGLSIAAGVPLTARRAWQALRVRTLDINVLMLIAAGGAIALGEWSEAGAVVFLFALAQTLEAYTLERARTAVRALMDLTPAEALLRDEAGERRVTVDAIAPGMVIIVKPGEKIPLDGEVVAGAS